MSTTTRPSMIGAALDYAARGWYIVPCHTPITDDKGHVIGCSCGNPKCERIGKHPRTRRGVWDASNDPKQIASWWKAWPDANIGWHPGQTGHIVLDLDKYKDEYAGDDLINPEDEETIRALTGGGGNHVVYAGPEDERLGNHRKTLPAGIDPKGYGGYVLLAPSLHPSGRRYQWENDYGPDEIEPRPLPHRLYELLKAAQASAVGSVTITSDLPEPDLAGLPDDILEQINNVAPRGTRSDVDWATIRYLVRSRWTDDQIVAVFQHCPIGTQGKYADANQGDPYLAKTIAKVRSRTAPDDYFHTGSDHANGFSENGTAIIVPTVEPEKPKPASEEPKPETADEAPEPNFQPYKIEDGRIHFYERLKSLGGKWKIVCDFTATITQIMIDEFGAKTFVISGQGVRGGPFTLEIGADEYTNKIRAALEASSGYDSVKPRMAEHAAEAIKQLTPPGSIIYRRRFNRTGWHGDRFLMPGREPAGVEIKLDDKAAAYNLDHCGDLSLGVEALDALIDGMGPYGSILASYILFPPLAALCGWRSDRYGLFLKGITGSLKTTTAQLAMSVWGRRFATEQLFEKVGSHGATANGILGRAAEISDLPFMIDNFKPNTQGKDTITSLIHSIMEGYTKSRQTRDGKNAPTRPINAWPTMTGEDTPGTDTAALARLLIVPMESRKGVIPEGIKKATILAAHLQTIGKAWLDLLETDGDRIAGIAKAAFEEYRAEFAEHIRVNSPEAENILRSATNLALNAAAWIALAELPALKELVAGRFGAHNRALYALADQIHQHTAQHLESHKFLDILSELIAAGRVHLIAKGEAGTPYGIPVIGWVDDNDEINLYPSIVRQQIDLVGRDVLNGMTMNAIYAQLQTMGLVVVNGTETTRARRGPDGRTARVLVLKPEALGEREATAEELGLP